MKVITRRSGHESIAQSGRLRYRGLAHIGKPSHSWQRPFWVDLIMHRAKAAHHECEWKPCETTHDPHPPHQQPVPRAATAALDEAGLLMEAPLPRVGGWVFAFRLSHFELDRWVGGCSHTPWTAEMCSLEGRTTRATEPAQAPIAPQPTIPIALGGRVSAFRIPHFELRGLGVVAY